jgi:capsular polysaccharide biosynthesis protein
VFETTLLDLLMKRDEALAILWRRKEIVAGFLLFFVLATAVYSKALPEVYVTESTLLVTLSEPQSFDTVQASQSLARTYANIVESPNVAELVGNRLGRPRDEVLSTTVLEPVVETQLLKIIAEGRDPQRAKLMADVYADVAVDYAAQQFGSATKARVSLADPAPLPRRPDRPKPTLYTLLAAVLGLPLGLGLAFLRDRLDRGRGGAEDVDEIRPPPPVTATERDAI